MFLAASSPSDDVGTVPAVIAIESMLSRLCLSQTQSAHIISNMLSEHDRFIVRLFYYGSEGDSLIFKAISDKYGLQNC